MTPDDFEDQLKRDGYLDIHHRSVERGQDTQPHRHDFDTRLLIIEGEMTVVCDGVARTARAGEVIDVPAGTQHCERYAPRLVRFIAGRRHAPES